MDLGAHRHGARGGDDHGGRHRAQVLARQGQRDRGAGPRPDEGQGPGGQDPQARAAREAGVPALPEDARGGRSRRPAEGRLSAGGGGRSPAGGLQGLLPVRRAHAGDRRARPDRERGLRVHEGGREARRSSSPTR